MNIYAQQLGKLGGLKTLSIKGKDYYKELGRKGGLAKRKKNKLLLWEEIWEGNWMAVCPNHRGFIKDCWKEHPRK